MTVFLFIDGILFPRGYWVVAGRDGIFVLDGIFCTDSAYPPQKNAVNFLTAKKKILSIDGIISDIFHRRYGVTVFYFIDGIFFLRDNGT